MPGFLRAERNQGLDGCDEDKTLIAPAAPSGHLK